MRRAVCALWEYATQKDDTGRLHPCREETIDDSQVYKQQMAAMSGGAQMMDVNKAFAGERQALEMVRHPVHNRWRSAQEMKPAR
jgi:hypothetical protein